MDTEKIKIYDKDNYTFDFLNIFAENIRIIIFIPFTLALVTMLYLILIAKPSYSSVSKIISSSSSGRVSQAQGIAAQFGINLPASNSEPKWVYPEIIKSHTLSKKVLKRDFETYKFGKNKSLQYILTQDIKGEYDSPEILELIASKRLLKMISVSENFKTGVYTITVDAFEPGLAKGINSAIIEELDNHQKDYNRIKTSDTRKFIEDRIVTTEQELRNAEESLKNFLDRNRRIENSPSLQLQQQRLAREATVLTGVFTTLKQQLETTKIEEVKSQIMRSQVVNYNSTRSKQT